MVPLSVMVTVLSNSKRQARGRMAVVSAGGVRGGRDCVAAKRLTGEEIKAGRAGLLTGLGY